MYSDQVSSWSWPSTRCISCWPWPPWSPPQQYQVKQGQRYIFSKGSKFFPPGHLLLARLCNAWKLSKPKLNHNSTQPNITKVGFYMKMTLQPTPAPPPPDKYKGSLQKPQMNIYWPQLNMMWSVTTSKASTTTLITTTTTTTTITPRPTTKTTTMLTTATATKEPQYN